MSASIRIDACIHTSFVNLHLLYFFNGAHVNVIFKPRIDSVSEQISIEIIHHLVLGILLMMLSTLIALVLMMAGLALVFLCGGLLALDLHCSTNVLPRIPMLTLSFR